ncbi:hypothetical protein EJ05DRAFT_200296 [Pseudovirgaria hyperparasitica]|uniref:Disintegrin and metalloproteinase domain-containing protein B n=1 Tax=Pseudovirgaria hyperparasitica TaxID=470096 RepID=A0A6A6WK31_9PEZI|nr:uncharacterized protein EJ05DRAFT_200296 [Pseudovirgaria hyperparasitica]KAF2762191.1 hypothetical protein EJ05DRAFT_200296 [Pseudovirgaria hyperparasitica]
MMLILPLLTTALAFATDVFARSTSRNPITALANVQNATIHTNNGRIHHLSHFDLSFHFFNTYAKLSLEPNHDIIAEGATITVIGSDGIERSEPLVRSNHKVYKGTAWVWTQAEKWERAGSARVYVQKDGVHPTFSGSFAVNHVSHHVQLASNYRTSRHELDPSIEDSEDEYMVLWRDSDISAHSMGHSELKRDGQEKACRADTLLFNTAPEHPVYARMLRRDESFWAASIDSLLGKRQIDGTPGGNSAGVNLVSTIGQTTGCPSSRQVALVGVAYDCNYLAEFNSNTSAVSDNIIDVMNSASDIYERTFNITLGLKSITSSPACSSSSGSPAWNVPCSQNINIEQRLNLFSQWRGEQSDNNSHWTLLSTCATDSAVGLAWLGQACIQGSQANGGNSAETVAGANVVYRTGGGGSEWQIIAHETGHTFGAVHDCTSQTCSDGTTVNAQQCCPLQSTSNCDAQAQFIMNPSTSNGISAFSQCTIGNICSAFSRRSVSTSCFTNNRDVTLVTGQQCGNGIVEGDEQCDCGGADNCGNNACCDGATCRFRNNAVCDDANEPCCSSCQLASSSTVCRASTGECDPEERCSGTAATCPTDVQTPDGTSCSNNLQCTSGQCTSRDMQCKTVMGSYTQGNDTYACDDSSCSISCGSPEFGPGVCYGLKQNFLDGTDCGGGGRCQNGRCDGSSLGGRISSWVERNRSLVIGVSAGVGGLLLLGILSCIIGCCRRRRRSRKLIPVAPPVLPPAGMAGFYGRSRGGGSAGRPHGGSNTGAGAAHIGSSSPHHGSDMAWSGPVPPPLAHRGSSTRYA